MDMNRLIDNKIIQKSIKMSSPLKVRNSTKVDSMKDRFDFILKSDKFRDYKMSDNDQIMSTNFSHNFKKRGVSSSTNMRKSGGDFFNKFTFDD